MRRRSRHRPRPPRLAPRRRERTTRRMRRRPCPRVAGHARRRARPAAPALPPPPSSRPHTSRYWNLKGTIPSPKRSRSALNAVAVGQAAAGAAAEAVSAANAASTAARGRMLARARSSGGRHAGAGHGSEPRRGGSAVHVLAAAACPQARTGALQAPAAVASGKSPTSCALGGGLCRGGAAESGGNDKDTRTAAGRRRRRSPRATETRPPSTGT